MSTNHYCIATIYPKPEAGARAMKAEEVIKTLTIADDRHFDEMGKRGHRADVAESRGETLEKALREIGLALSTFAPCGLVGGCGHRPTCVEIATLASLAAAALKEKP
jgi:hypothetical protein